jgi:uncharacterized protein (DUF2141 family)
MFIPLAALIAQLAGPPASPAAAQGGEIAVTVTGIHSENGHVLMLLYTSEEGFPTEPRRAKRRLKLSISGGRANTRLGDIAPGTYALSVFHDENDNGNLDTNWIGIPKEGVGASNNAKGRMGPPKFKDAEFEVGATRVTQRIRIEYL